MTKISKKGSAALEQKSKAKQIFYQ